MRWIFTIGLIILFNYSFGQTKGNLSGWVVDKNTQKPIAGVTVKLFNSPYSTSTDSAGNFQFRSIPTGQYQLKFTSLGSEIGRSSSGTGIISPSSLYMIGIGQPQYLCLEMPQSFKR